jgi:hypothetical protein
MRTAVATRLVSLGDHRIGAPLLQHSRLGDRGRRADHRAAVFLDGAYRLRVGEAEVETHHRRSLRQDRLEPSGIESRNRVRRLRDGPETQLLVVGSQPAPQRPRAFGVKRRLAVHEEVDVERPVGKGP